MESFIYGVLTFLADLGYLGIMLGLMIEVIPSEIVLAYGGFLVAQGKIHFIGAMVAGTIGGVFSQLFLYWLGYYGGRPLLKKYGKYLLIHERHLDVAERWFEKYGPGVIFAARFIPVVRHAISVPAGIAKMGVWLFILYTTLAIIPWSFLFLIVGEQIGANWMHVKELSGQYLPYIVAAAVGVFILYFLYVRKSEKGKAQ
ncbi:Uncharacterized membrane protein YngC [[Clostridium] ultunense Esp]|uniref:DedA family protein n=1 Tax=Thermicanus aegyptius TaxID=94009 RepID=UPI0002B6FD48|nr:DedA family protein [Thermicanus aegyptius]CCQ96392.1 Uncharacterized membrane protein YngC [[Clostridium] ultunense Esp]